MGLNTPCPIHGNLHPDFLCREPQKVIVYPYIPPGRTFSYVPLTCTFMALAKAYARAQSLDTVMPGAAVVVKDDRVIGIGANGSTYHMTHQCERVTRGCKSGEGYELCEGCHPKNHSEPTAIANACRNVGVVEVRSSKLFLWGHWWCCKPCWEVMEAIDISQVFLLEGSEVLFNKEDPCNIVGKQFVK